MADKCGIPGKKIPDTNKLGLPSKGGLKPVNTGLGNKPYPGTTKTKKKGSY